MSAVGAVTHSLVVFRGQAAALRSLCVGGGGR